MTSKTLFRKLYRDECRRTLWITLCIGLLFMFLKPIYTLLHIDNLLLNNSMTMEQIRILLTASISFGGGNNSLIAPVLAIFLALLSFSWLFFDKKVDLIHTIPLKREKLFFVYYCNGFAMFFIPYTIAMLLQLLTVVVKGLYSVSILQTVAIAFLYTCIYFLVYYHVAILAVMLTGNILVCMAATGVFILYYPVVDELISNYFSSYMDSYYMNHDVFTSSIPRCFASPLLSQLYMMDTAVDYKVPVLCITILIALAILLLSVTLYTKRSSEAAGKALAFPKTASFICILIVIPCALLGGLYVRYIGMSLSDIWFWFALICAGILAHCAMEIIFHFDFRAAFGQKLQLLLTLAISAVIALAFQNDWMQYDTYLPDSKEIASAAIYFGNIDMDMNYVEKDPDSLSFNTITYISRDEYLFGHMKLTDIEPVLALAKTGIQETKLVTEREKDDYDYDAFDFDQPVRDPILYYTICYTLRSGKKVYRQYYAVQKDINDAVARIYNSPEYKAASCQLDELKANNLLKGVKGHDCFGDSVFSLSGMQMLELVDAYSKDIYAQTYAQRCDSLPVMELDFQTSSYINLNAYYVYPDFSNTIDVLKKYDIQTENLKNLLHADNIKKITISHYRSENEPVEVIYDVQDSKQAEKIKTLSSKLLLSQFIYANPQVMSSTSSLDFQIICQQENGILKEVSASIPLSDIPEFLKEDLREAVK